MTYGELSRYSNRIANSLVALGLTPEACVGICLDKSHHAIAAMIGIMKAGLAFVPLDPEFPVDRLRFMVADAGISYCVTSAGYAPLVGDLNIALLPVESAFDSMSDSAPQITVDLEQLAYVMYTSGSTGNPKGVEIQHRALTNYCIADALVYELTEDDCTLQFSTLNFDIAIEEIFPPLMVGSTVAVRPAERPDAVNELSYLIERYQVTAIHMATAYWHEWVNLLAATSDTTPAIVRLMVVTGEKVSAEHYRQWRSMTDHSVLWANAYGPTETTVTATVFIPGPEWAGTNLPIGKPLSGYSARILDETLRDIADGQTGELFIGGPSLARGYLNRPDLTAKAFVTRDDGERLYRTGDLARWTADGNIEYAGRTDHQIKVGSFRIEPGEIEEALTRHADVQEALVLARELADGSSKQIVAYVGAGESECTVDELQEFIKQSLPVYMLPARYVLMPVLPKTINGKIDRAALPEPEAMQVGTEDDQTGLGAEAELLTETEKEVAGIWHDILGNVSPGREDNFFSLGGSSLMAVRFLATAIREFGSNLPSRHLMTENLAQIALRLNPADTISPSLAARNLTSSTSRRPLFFGPDAEQLYGVLHKPSGRPCRRAVLICPPIGHEYLRSHRSLMTLATELARADCCVLRFDYSGTGDSHGKLPDRRLGDWSADIEHAASFLRSQSGVEAIDLVGMRLGALLMLTSKADGFGRRVLWDPVSNGAQYIDELRAANRRELKNLDRFRWHQKQSDPNELFGYTFAGEMLNELSQIKLADQASVLSDRDLVVISEKAPSYEYEISQASAIADRKMPAAVLCDDGQDWNAKDSVDKIVLGHLASKRIKDFLS